MKDSFILAWEQGTGKTRGILVWGIVKAILEDKELTADIIAGSPVSLKAVIKRLRKRFLIVMPKNILMQWKTFCEELGIETVILTDVAQANHIKHTAPREFEFYFADYNIIKSSKRFPNQSLCEGVEIHPFYLKKIAPLSVNPDFWEKKSNSEASQWGDYFDGRRLHYAPIGCKEFCPQCKTVLNEGWNGMACKECGYTLYGYRFKGMAYVLKHTFDIIFLDESERIKNKDTIVGKAILSMRAKYRGCSSGTPIKAYIRDMYSVMHWTLGNATPRFPYDFGTGGLDKFLTDYGVWETRLEDRRKGLSKGTPKLLPEISNLALWWKLFFPAGKSVV